MKSKASNEKVDMILTAVQKNSAQNDKIIEYLLELKK
jgi:hypothetical protein